MRYTAVGDRCAVHVPDLNLPISDDHAIAVLRCLGIFEIQVDVVALARSLLTRATYKLGAVLSEAPAVVDCSSFTKWLYAQKGIWIPRLSVQQHAEGQICLPGDRRAGDLVFTRSHQLLYQPGHVGICTDEGSVIHASFSSAGVAETSYESFIARGFNGIRRVVLSNETRTFVSDAHAIESSDDLRWLILKNLR